MAKEYKYKHIVDVHTHLTDDLLLEDISKIIGKAIQHNVQAALVVTENKTEFQPVIDLYHRFPNFVLPCLGIHPIQSSGNKDEKGIDIKRSVSLVDYEGVEDMIENYQEVIGAVGEIGLDFTPRFCKSKEDKENQILIFSKQVNLAERLGVRDALLHAFDGRVSTALEGVRCGFYFSVPASVCRDEQLQKLVKMLPLEHLMVETDSPAISPVKGTVNEPSNAVISCEHIAKIKNVDIHQVQHMTTQNAVKLFPRLATLSST